MAEGQVSPWSDAVEGALADVRRIRRGDTLAAKESLRMAIVGLREVLKGRHPDPVRIVYLTFLFRALTKITKYGKEPTQALGLRPRGRPLEPPRSFTFFVSVGIELDKLARRSISGSIARKKAIAAVAKRYKAGDAAVEKAWRSYGGALAWQRLKAEDAGT